MKFSLGTIVVTAGVGDLMAENEHFKKFVGFSLCRYGNCDWGDLVEEDKTQNDEAFKYRDRILGAYKHPEHSEWKIWIVEEYVKIVKLFLTKGIDPMDILDEACKTDDVLSVLNKYGLCLEPFFFSPKTRIIMED